MMAYFMGYADGARSAFEPVDNGALRVGNMIYYSMGYDDGAKSIVVAVDKVPYNFRASGGGLAIGDREIDKLVGGTVVWNQHVLTSFKTKTITPDGSYTYSITTISYKGIIGHVYYSHVDITQYIGEKTLRAYVMFGSSDYGSPGMDLTGQKGSFSWVGKCRNPQNMGVGLSNLNTSDKLTSADAWTYDNFIIIDLTQMFGETIADYIYSIEIANPGAGVAWFRKLFPKDYYAYNAGELMSVNAGAHVMRDAAESIIGDYPLDHSLTLRGIPKLDESNALYYDGDTYASDGTVTQRYGILTDQTGAIGNTITLIGAKSDLTEIITSAGHLADVGTISGTTLTLTKALNGDTIVYELAIPTTEAAEPFQNPQIVDAAGTEEYVDYAESQGTRDVAIPVGHETKYKISAT